MKISLIVEAKIHTEMFRWSSNIFAVLLLMILAALINLSMLLDKQIPTILIDGLYSFTFFPLKYFSVHVISRV